MWYGGDPACAVDTGQLTSVYESDCTTLFFTVPRCKFLCLQEWTQPSHRGLLLTVSTFHRGYGVGGHHKITTLIIVLLAASAATAFPSRRKSGLLFIDKALWIRKQNSCAIVLCAHPMEIEACERNVLSGSRVRSAVKHQFGLV